MREGKRMRKPIFDIIKVAQFTSARRIINGTDKAGKIAGEASKFQAALQAGGW